MRASTGCSLSCAIDRRDRGRLPVAAAGAGTRRRASGGFRALRHADHQSLRARVQRHRARSAPDAAGAARRPHAAARLRDLPGDRVEDADSDGPEARIPALFSFVDDRGRPAVRPNGGRAGPARMNGARGACAPPTPATTSSSPSPLRRARPCRPAQAPRHQGALHQPRPADPRRHAGADAGER